MRAWKGRSRTCWEGGKLGSPRDLGAEGLGVQPPEANIGLELSKPYAYLRGIKGTIQTGLNWRGVVVDVNLQMVWVAKVGFVVNSLREKAPLVPISSH